MNQHKILDLLKQAGSAHHTYEQTVLKGVYDQEWAIWYAKYIVDNGINDLLSQSLTAEQMGDLLEETNTLHGQTDQSQSWPEFASRIIAERFGT
ncbi:hypothetical protein KFU94_02770 [Chloroflexi bacterium TSY]|nr:hypothetical protein [Chloroflexi bacterium TSY]